MKIGIGSYSYHRQFGDVYPDQQPPETTLTLEDFLRKADAMGAQSVSIEASFLKNGEKSYLEDLKSELDGYGLARTLSWSHPDGLKRGRNDELFAQMKAYMPVAQALGAKIMRVAVTSGEWRTDSHHEQLEMLRRPLQDAARAAQDEGIKLAISNESDLTANELTSLIEDAGPANVGADFNTGNFVRIMTDPVAALDVLAQYTLTVTLKDVQPNSREASPWDWYYFSCVPVGEGCVNNQAILSTLDKADFAGMVNIEVDHPHSDWYGREDEMVLLSLHAARNLINNL